MRTTHKIRKAVDFVLTVRSTLYGIVAIFAFIAVTAAVKDEVGERQLMTRAVANRNQKLIEVQQWIDRIDQHCNQLQWTDGAIYSLSPNRVWIVKMYDQDGSTRIRLVAACDAKYGSEDRSATFFLAGKTVFDYVVESPASTTAPWSAFITGARQTTIDSSFLRFYADE